MPKDDLSRGNMARLYAAAAKKVQSRLASQNKALSSKPDRLLRTSNSPSTRAEIAKTFKESVSSKYGSSLDSSGTAKGYLDKVNKTRKKTEAAFKSGRIQ
jgi:hypothetical protein